MPAVKFQKVLKYVATITKQRKLLKHMHSGFPLATYHN